MSSTIFNREIKKLITNEKHPVIEYIDEKFQKSRQYSGYYGFFDSFLYDFGILTLGHAPTLKGSKYVPYVNCTLINVFSEEKGITDLSIRPQSLTNSQKIVAQYLINQLKKLQVQNFEDWNSGFNNGK